MHSFLPSRVLLLSYCLRSKERVFELFMHFVGRLLLMVLRKADVGEIVRRDYLYLRLVVVVVELFFKLFVNSDFVHFFLLLHRQGNLRIANDHIWEL